MTNSHDRNWQWVKPFTFSLLIAATMTTLFYKKNSQEIFINTDIENVAKKPMRSSLDKRTHLAPNQVSYIRTHLLYPPSKGSYNLTYTDRKTDLDFSYQTRHANGIFNSKKNGFFVEIRARDGESRSHSLYFEKFLSWTGVLVEPDPSLFRSLLTKNRKAYSVNARMALAETVQFSPEKKQDPNVPTINLFDLMQAVNRTKIDFLSLDMDGDELKVLSSVPWDKMKVRLMRVTVDRMLGGPQFLTDYMEQHGYATLGQHGNDMWIAYL